MLSNERKAFQAASIAGPNSDFSNFPENWATAVGMSVPRFESLHRMVDTLYDPAKPIVCPPRSAVFRAFHLIAPQDVSVVILGQDPYPALCLADGLAFSAPPRTRTPGSLKSIFDALEADTAVNFSRPDEYDSDLSKWSDQKVLLLNSALTVQNGKAGSHLDEWHDFILDLLRLIGGRADVAFLLWGEKSAKKAREAGINIMRRGVLTAAHPRSAASAANPLLTARHFSKCNDFLRSIQRQEIDWALS